MGMQTQGGSWIGRYVATSATRRCVGHVMPVQAQAELEDVAQGCVVVLARRSVGWETLVGWDREEEREQARKQLAACKK
eukprot:5085906-Pleurochrysis_carterae.AAC.2